jgi:hypothetical protein
MLAFVGGTTLPRRTALRTLTGHPIAVAEGRLSISLCRQLGDGLLNNGCATQLEVAEMTLSMFFRESSNLVEQPIQKWYRHRFL